jgi:hypothetical protein
MPYFKVKYYAGPYSGTRSVNAEDEDQAIAIVKHQIRKDMSLPMYSDGYRIIDSDETNEDE